MPDVPTPRTNAFSHVGRPVTLLAMPQQGDSHPTTEKSAPSAAPRERLHALDWLRGIAVLVMAECHVFNALLAPEYRSASWFSVLNWLNGFVAPAFLLVSGGVMGMNLQRGWEKGTARRWRRVGQIFVVAYLLHLPTPLLWQYFGPRGPHLIELWTKMDILQCIAGSLAIILLLVPVTRTPRIHRAACAALGILAATCATPVASWAAGVGAPKWLLNYLWPTGVGKFPLVPWAAFPLIGVCLGPAIFNCIRSVSFDSPAVTVTQQTALGGHAAAKGQRPRMAQTMRALMAGAAMLVASRFMTSPIAYDGPFVFERLGWVLIGLAACCWLDKPWRGTKWILEFGELSLWSYTVHLIIVYGSCISLGLDTLVPLAATWWVRCANPDAPVVVGFSPLVVLAWLVAVLFVTALVVRWRVIDLQRRVALRMMPAE
jgi:uncharacterized membrane protein